MPFGHVELNDGNKLPLIAFGTGTALYGKDATDSVVRAIDNGFDHIDTASNYNNEESVGTAIKESGLGRNEFFLTTKYDGGDIAKEARASLAKLGLMYADLYLIHFPGLVTGRFEAAWAEFEQLKEDGLVRSIGVSNFSAEDLQLLAKTAKVTPAVNQIRLHPYNLKEQAATLAYCAARGITVAAYSALTPLTRTPGGPVDAPVRAAAAARGATPAQVLLLWARAKGAALVTTSSRTERLREYLAAGDLLPLTPAEVAAIDAAGALGPPKSRWEWAGRAAAALALGAYGAWSLGYLQPHHGMM